ncbi:GMC family oxidoreductase [Nguyenibacter sp. L1]|uniref:GMC family oxidoreductase n=1 Tax=Nguyenibacter sp. L1 TaxID=3049350 RepID=UPI002B4A7104|nr:GMC family oxidoreductase [Nguyenibacter sp. L1]WRH88781.1 GMC family oxidoreductase [Nguyenibacter sp. L1]
MDHADPGNRPPMPFSPDKDYDVLIVGSGAAGSFAAKELTERGLSVVLLEAGPEITTAHFPPMGETAPRKDINIWERARATLKGQSVQARAAFFSEQFASFFVNDRMNPYTTPRDAPFLWIRGRQSGGRLHSFGRVLLRWTDDDFKGASRTGVGEDWPLSYADLEPYYDFVETYLGVYGNADHVPNLPDGKFAAPAALTPAEEAFRHRLEHDWPGWRATSWRYVAPDILRVPKPLRAALATGRLALRADAIVRRVMTDPVSGLATGAVFTDRLTRQDVVVRAGAVMLCASPIESIRLLLNSACARHPQGVGNASGILGRYFMDQLPCLAFGAYPAARGWVLDRSAPADPFYAPSGGLYIPRAEERTGAARPFSGGFTYQGTIGRSQVADDVASRLSFFGFGQMQPYADNRVTLDVRRKDAWGIPVPHIRCVPHANEIALLQAQEDTMLEMIRAMGGETEFIGSPLGLREFGRGAFPDADPLSRFMFRRWFGRTMCMGAAIHESGGARMGTAPGRSVLNAHNQCWDVPNLYVTDASAFPTGGSVGTTLTVMALTVRACAHLADGHPFRAQRA